MTLSNAIDQDTRLGAYALATEAEIAQVRTILAENGHFPESARMAYLGLEDPRRDATESRSPLPRLHPRCRRQRAPRTSWSP